jgi:HK97 family phage major capsid protein
MSTIPAPDQFMSNSLRLPAQPRGATISEIDRKASTGGFKSFGHFAWCVVKCGKNGRGGHPEAVMHVKGWEDVRAALSVKTPSGQFEESDHSGGLLVPPQYSTDLYERTYNQNQILRYLNPIPLGVGRQVSIPALKEDSRADSSRHGTVLGYWEGEADQYQAQKPQLRRFALMLHKLTVLVYATEELIEDSPRALESYLTPLAAAEINFKINDAVINGTGAGMPEGILKAGSKITATAQSGQGGSTIVADNVLAMNARITPALRRNALVLYNQDAEAQLLRFHVSSGQHSAANLVWYRDDGQLMVCGHPALLIEQCASLGTEGDLIFFAPDGYQAAVRSGIEEFMSMHLSFDYDQSVFKWRFRMDGQVKDDVALTPYKGSATTSSVVTLSSTRT